MKKSIVWLLLIGLLLTCFAGCKEEPTVTPTDTAFTETQSAVDDQSQKQPDTKQEDLSKEEPVVSKDNKEDTVSAVKTQDSKKPVASQPKAPVKPEDIHAEIAVEHPNFVSEAALKTWLLNGSGAFETQRSEYLTQAVSNQTITYYRPSDDLSQYVVMDKIELYTPSDNYTYRYYFKECGEQSHNGSPDIRITVSGVGENRKGAESIYEAVKKNYENGEGTAQQYVNPDNGNVVYYEVVLLDNYSIVWEQYDRVCFANLASQHADMLDELLPLLALEPVTLRTDLVTQ